MPLLKHHDTAPEVAAAPRSVAALLDALRGDTAAERRSAALDLIGEPEAAAALAAALGEEPDVGVRQAIVTALVGADSAPAAVHLAALLGSEDTALRNLAIEALQRMGQTAAPQIERLLAAPEADLRIFAINVLEALPHPAARGWLRAVLDHEPDVNVGLAAVEALAGIGGPKDVSALHGFAARFPEEPFVGFAVAEACRRVLPGGGV